MTQMIETQKKHPDMPALALQTGLAIALGSFFIYTQPVQAASIDTDWKYAIDSFNDSIDINDVGGTQFEIYGMAIKQTINEVVVAINTNLPPNGTSYELANDNHVSWGDLLFNFSGSDLSTASTNGSLFGVRFADNNGSGAPQMGVYGNVTAKSIAKDNGILLNNLNEYNGWVSQNGGTPSNGDLSANNPYFDGNQHVQNVIASGLKLGGINLLPNFDGLGLDFQQFGANGKYNITFSFARSLLPSGSFTAHLAPECDNDIIAITGELSDVPEPTTLLGSIAFGIGAGWLRKKRASVLSQQNGSAKA